MPVLHQTDIVLRRNRLHRRDFLRGLSVASLAAGGLSWTDLVSVHAADLRRRGMACILLWMQGGPSQFETFDPKPGHANGADTKTVNTAVPGIEIAEGFPHVAAAMQDIALIRSMTTKEGNHQRATFLLHTGYVPTNSVKHPTLGALVSQQLASADCELPSFVRIGGRFANAGGGGILGVDFDPFNVDAADRPPANTTFSSGTERFRRRLDLLGRLEDEYGASGAAREVADHQKLYAKASKMVLSSQMKAFDLAAESNRMRDAYGRTDFGNGCLLARRLVEEGVTFVEVSAGNWDTHQDNFERTKGLAKQVDQPFAQLVADLKDRGMLDRTLVIWMGEFGRTPRINGRGGRDHYPRAFSVALAGGGIRGGQVIGRTDAGGVEVADRPVTVHDLFQTFCKSLELDANKENMSSIGRPLKVVDGGEPVRELFG
jgi:hypothetical protein